MPLASWTQVEAEARRIGAADLKALAARGDAGAFVWAAPHLEADVGKQPIDGGAMTAMQALAD